nr:SPFH domain-containing protein [Lacticaseibacillus kribbianus]
MVTAFTGAISGTLADQWREIITAGKFDEQVVVAPGIFVQTNNDRGSNTSGSVGVITSGSKVYVPENTAMFIFSDGGIEDIVDEAGGYIYEDGQETILDTGRLDSIFKQVKNRFEFGGQPDELKHVAYVNLREIRGLKFGTKGPQVYHDGYYDVDLEVLAYGTYSVRVVDPVKFIRRFVPANADRYSLSDRAARAQLLPEFLQTFSAVLNSLSGQFRVSQLPSQTLALSQSIKQLQENPGSWIERFGLEISSVGIENIQLSEASRALVNRFASDRMSVSAFNGLSRQAGDMAAQQKIARGIEEKGLGDSGAGMLLGVNLTEGLSGSKVAGAQPSIDEQVNLLKKLKALLDAGILTEDEFTQKKREILGL